MIQVEGLGRSFRSMNKKEGLKESIKFLFNPDYVTKWAIRDISFKVGEGEFVGLIGANGAGKTTLLKCLSGLIPPTVGTLKVLGMTPFERKIQFRKQIALVMGQKAQLWWDLPATETFELVRAIYDVDREIYKKRLNQLIELLQVGNLMQTQIRKLSLGERMKMELIGAILHWPKVIYLDEPTIGLDVVAAQSLRGFLKTFNENEGSTVLLTSHNMDDIESLCPRILILRDGKLIFDDAPQKLKQDSLIKITLRFRQAPDVDKILRDTGISLQPAIVSEETEGTHPNLSSWNADLERSQVPKLIQSTITNSAASELMDVSIQERSLESVIAQIYTGSTGNV